MPSHPGPPRPREPIQRFPIAARGRRPTPAESNRITVAVRSSALVAEAGWRVVVSPIRISRVNPSWAFVVLWPSGPDGPGPALGVLRLGPAGWVLRQVGTYGVGRDFVPAAVLVEFGLLGDDR